MSAAETASAAAALAAFAAGGRPLSLEPHEGGLVNSSWLAVVETPDRPQRLLLQRINRHVFREPVLVMENMQRVTRHVQRQLASERRPDGDRRVLQLLPALNGSFHHVDPAGETWRLVRWVEGVRSTSRAHTEREAREAARAFGRFLRRLAALPGGRLHETIPGFHDTERRLLALRTATASDPAGRAAGARPEIEALLDRAPLAGALAERAAAGELPERPVHNDAKIANVLFDAASGEALCVVDLDTVMPGFAPYDFGDLARSIASDSDEDERDLARVAVRPSFLRALLDGFVEGASETLSARERELLPTGALVITYEQALRFLTDHLEGDRYYRTLRPAHNLERARAQIALLASLERETKGKPAG